MMQHETDRTAKRQRRDWGSEPVYRGLEAHRTTASDHGPAPMSINQLLLHQPLPAPPVLFSTQDSYGNQDLDLGNPDSFASPAATSSIHTDEYAINPRFLVASEQLHSLQITSAQSNAPTRAPSPDPQLGKSEEKLSGCHKTSMRILCSRQRQNYLKNYMKNVAPWLDMFDFRRHFGIQLPFMAQESPTLLYAILALSARHRERKELRKSYESLELYQDAIGLLAPSLQARDPNILATSVILCCLEMMSASPHNWRRHLEGCAALFESFSVNGFSGGLLQAVFWCYIRMDLCSAVISEGKESTVLPISCWVPPNTRGEDIAGLFAASESPDMHANYSVYLCSKVCDLLATRTKYLLASRTGHIEGHLDNDCTNAKFARIWNMLWEECQAWVRSRPLELIPLKIVTASDGELFPQVFFSHWAAISSNQLYHQACMLLLDNQPETIKLENEAASYALWHAKRAIGISMTNPHEGCLNNSIQPLWMAGKLLTHRSEHLAVVKLIKNIEALTGWGVCWRIKDLEEAWGYEKGELYA